MIQILFKDGSITDIPAHLGTWFSGAGSEWFVVRQQSGDTVYYRGDSILKIRLYAPGEEAAPKSS